MRASDLYQAIDTILYDEWDPLGINDMEDARDEFRAYVTDIFELTTRRAGSASIAKQLSDIATYKMGVPSNMQIAGKSPTRSSHWFTPEVLFYSTNRTL